MYALVKQGKGNKRGKYYRTGCDGRESGGSAVITYRQDQDRMSK
jgi:hypothetical protein